MKKKNGFTLVELLAVIAILAILVIIALPNILEMFNRAKKSSFENELKTIYTAAEEKYIGKSFEVGGSHIFAHLESTECDNDLNLSGRSNIEYFIEINSQGKVIKYYASDGKYQYSYSGSDLKKTDIKESQFIPEITNNKYVRITCTSAKLNSPEPISRAYYLMKGSSSGSETSNFLRTGVKIKDIEKITFVSSIGSHKSSDENTWDVSYGANGSVLAWSTDIDNNGLYEVNIGTNGDIYLDDGSYLFYNMKNLKSVDGLENINTSKVTSMNNMFAYSLNLRELNVSNFDTSNVTNMRAMFSGLGTDTNKRMNLEHIIGLENFDTSNVTDMSGMFQYCSNLKELNLSSFDTSKVTTMNRMFSGWFNGNKVLKNLDISNFKTPNLTNAANLFDWSSALEVIDISNFDFSKCNDDTSMFYYLTNLKKVYVKDENAKSYIENKLSKNNINNVDVIIK